MLVLGIDSSTMTGGAALVDQTGLIGEYTLHIRSTHSERLLPAIERLCDDADVSLRDIGGIAVVSGPGSFTGLRIGVTTAKGFAYALDKPVAAVTTFQALAWQNQLWAGPICTMVDARRHEVYAQVFRGGEPITEPWNGPVTEAIQWGQSQPEPVLFVGDGVLANWNLLTTGHLTPPREQLVLRASSVAGIGLSFLTHGESVDAIALAPFYMRKSEAERRWESKTK